MNNIFVLLHSLHLWITLRLFMWVGTHSRGWGTKLLGVQATTSLCHHPCSVWLGSSSVKLDNTPASHQVLSQWMLILKLTRVFSLCSCQLLWYGLILIIWCKSYNIHRLTGSGVGSVSVQLHVIRDEQEQKLPMKDHEVSSGASLWQSRVLLTILSLRFIL